MKNVPVAEVATTNDSALPVRVQEALGELAGAAQEGLMALSVGVGLGVLSELMEEELSTRWWGPRGATSPIGAPCATATRPRSRSLPTPTSQTATRSRRWCGAIQDAVGLDRVAPVDVAATADGAVAFNPTEWYAFSDHSPIVATFED